MESPVVLLKSAAFESDVQQRTDKVIKACKIITDLLPYDKKSQALIEEPELMKYLMITLPLNPRSIDLIIATMIDKFKKVNYFLKETWQGFLSVAQMEETEKKVDDPTKLVQLGIKSLLKFSLTKDLDELGQTMKPSYNDQITAKRDTIKLAVLGYIEKFLEMYIKELKKTSAFKPDISDLLKKFFSFTTNEMIMNKTCTIVEKIKGLDPEFDFDNEVEEALNSKKDPQSRTSTSRTNLEEQKQDKMKGSHKKHSKSSNEGAHSPFQKHNRQSVLDEVEEFKSSDEDNTSEDDGGDATPSHDGFSAEASTEIEGWLSDGKIILKFKADPPLISKSEFAKEFLQDEVNFDILFSFIFDPRGQALSECWKQKHPNMSSFLSEQEKPAPLIPSSREALALPKLRENKQLHPYVLRSFKVMLLFCDERNYNEITQTSSLFIGRFFQEFHKYMTTKEDLMCNLNHVMTVIEFFFAKEPKICLNYILHYNLLFKLFQNIEVYYIQRFLLTILNCLPNSKEFDNQLYHKVLDYLRLTSLFVDISKVILNGERNFPKDKCKGDYKPEGITDIVDISMDPFELSNKPVTNFNIFNDKIPISLIEETKGFELDIDNFKEILKTTKPINPKELTKKNPSKARPVSKNNLKRYPSLVEKHYYDDIDAAQISLASTKSEMISQPKPDVQSNQSKQSNLKTDKPSPQPVDPNNNKSSPTKGSKAVSLDVPTTTTKNPPRASPTKLSQSPVPPKTVTSSTSPKKQPAQEKSEPKQETKAAPKQEPETKQLPKQDSKQESKSEPKQESKPEPKQPSKQEIKQDPKQATVTQPAAKDPVATNQKKVEEEKSNEKLTEQPAPPLIKKEVVFEPSVKTRGSGIAKSNEKVEYVPPEKKTILKEFDMEVLGKKELEHLNELYPTSTKNMTPTPLDKEAKKPEFKMRNIKATDQFSLALCEFLDVLFQRMLSIAKNSKPFQVNLDIPNLKTTPELLKRYELKLKLGNSRVDHDNFWKAVFVNDCQLFGNILTNYLIKIKVHHFEEINSGFASGFIVNSILSQCLENEALKPYANTIQNICRDNFSFLCKTIIQSVAWVDRANLKVYLQDYEVKESLGSGRISLVKTLSLIIQNDDVNNYDILSQINDTCWHTLIIWFFTKRTNNIYHQIFYSIMQLTFLHTNEKTILNILFKLNLLSYLYKTWTEIYQNNVLLKENHVESICYYLKKLTQLIDKTAQAHEHYTTLAEQLAASVSWSSLKSKLAAAKKDKKKAPADKTKGKNNNKPPTSSTPTRGGAKQIESFQNTASSFKSSQQSPSLNHLKDSPPAGAKKKTGH